MGYEKIVCVNTIILILICLHYSYDKQDSNLATINQLIFRTIIIDSEWCIIKNKKTVIELF